MKTGSAEETGRQRTDTSLKRAPDDGRQMPVLRRGTTEVRGQRSAIRNQQSAIGNRKFSVMNYLTTIGLEVHVQLQTRTKMFCACRTDFGAAPNTQVCPVCLGYPGALPVITQEAIRLTVMTGLMVGSRINPLSKFDRKNYFYPDMPKNYQITQFDQP